VETAIGANEAQKLRMVDKIAYGLNDSGSLTGKKIAVLGLAFKPNTDDLREAPSLMIIEGLVKKGAHIHACDPEALDEAAWRFKDIQESITFFTDEYQAMERCDALVIMTEWNQYRSLDLEKVKRLLAAPVFFDLHNAYKRADLEHKGFKYFAVGQ
jgi:UDPglucose 6-dehydrogenase